jgi:hypothetical protein
MTRKMKDVSAPLSVVKLLEQPFGIAQGIETVAALTADGGNERMRPKGVTFVVTVAAADVRCRSKRAPTRRSARCNRRWLYAWRPLVL